MYKFKHTCGDWAVWRLRLLIQSLLLAVTCCIFFNHNQHFSAPNQRACRLNDVNKVCRLLWEELVFRNVIATMIWHKKRRWLSKESGASLLEESIEIHHIDDTKKVPLTPADSVQLSHEWVFLLFYLKKKTNKPEFTMCHITRGFLFIHLFIHVFAPAQGRPSCALRLHSPCNIGTEYRFCHEVIVLL